jgi:hypothetical protein
MAYFILHIQVERQQIIDFFIQFYNSMKKILGTLQIITFIA